MLHSSFMRTLSLKDIYIKNNVAKMSALRDNLSPNHSKLEFFEHFTKTLTSNNGNC